MAVMCVLEHRLHLLLGWGGESGCGLVTVRYSSRGRGCPSDGRSGSPLHLLFLLQLIRLQVHVRGGHGALHVWVTAANREKQASLPSHHSQKTWVFSHTEAGKHALNIHAILLSRFDMSLALIDRKPLGHMLAMNVRNRRKGRKNELVFKYSVCMPVRLFVSLCLCWHVPPFFHRQRVLLCAPTWGWVCRGRGQKVSPIHCALFG